jgi:hypothetical protein
VVSFEHSKRIASSGSRDGKDKEAQYMRNAAMDVQLVSMNVAARHRGRVDRIDPRETKKGNSSGTSTGWIRCENLERLVSFHSRQLQNPGPSLKAGDCVEFNIDEKSSHGKHGRAQALRILRLPANSVTVETVDDTPRIGYALRPRKKRAGQDIAGLLLVCKVPTSGEKSSEVHPACSVGATANHIPLPVENFSSAHNHPAALVYGDGDLLFMDKKHVQAGDALSFKIATHINFPKQRRAVQIQALPRRAVVEAALMDIATKDAGKEKDGKDSKQAVVLRCLPDPAHPQLPAVLEELFSVAKRQQFAGTLHPGDLVTFSDVYTGKPHGSIRMAGNPRVIQTNWLEAQQADEEGSSDEDSLPPMSTERAIYPTQRRQTTLKNSFAALGQTESEDDSD